VEGLITRAVVEAFSTNGRLKVVPPSEADAVLDGEVIGYSVSLHRLRPELQRPPVPPRRHRQSPAAGPAQERGAVQAERRARAVDFRVQNAVSQTISLEETALKAAAVEVGRSIVSLTITRF
jgi:hypothetical protein